MAKPIFLVGVSYKLDPNTIEFLQENLEQTIPDYHTIVYMHNKDESEFRAIYEKDFDEVKFEELKEIVRGSMIPSQK